MRSRARISTPYPSTAAASSELGISERRVRELRTLLGTIVKRSNGRRLKRRTRRTRRVTTRR